MHLNRLKRKQFGEKKKQKRKESKKGKKNSKELFEINSKMVVPVLIGVVKETTYFITHDLELRSQIKIFKLSKIFHKTQ